MNSIRSLMKSSRSHNHQGRQALEINRILVTSNQSQDVALNMDSAQDGEDAGDMLERHAINCVLLQFWMIELVTRKDHQLRAAVALLENPATVCHMILQELIQRETFDVNGLSKNKKTVQNQESLNRDGELMQFYLQHFLYITHGSPTNIQRKMKKRFQLSNRTFFISQPISKMHIPTQ